MEFTTTRLDPYRMTADPPETFADLIEKLDGIGPERIRLVPTPGTATEADLIALLERQPDKRLCELIEGTLIEKPLHSYNSCVAVSIGTDLWSYSGQHGRNAVVCGPDAAFRFAPGVVRMPNVTYTLRSRIPAGRGNVDIADWAPDLAVLILDPRHTRREISRKLHEYFVAGVRLVWLVDPEENVVRVFTSPDHVVELRDDDTLDGGDVLPGLQTTVRDLFRRV